MKFYFIILTISVSSGIIKQTIKRFCKKKQQQHSGLQKSMQKLPWWYHLSVQRMKKRLKQRGHLKCKASDTKWDPGGQMPDSKSCEWPSTKSWLAVCSVLPLPQKVFTFPLNLLDTWGQRRPELSRLEAKNRDKMLVCNQISVGMCCMDSCVLFHKKKKNTSSYVQDAWRRKASPCSQNI